MTAHIFDGPQLERVYLDRIGRRLTRIVTNLPADAFLEDDGVTPHDPVPALLASIEGDIVVPALDWTERRLTTREARVETTDGLVAGMRAVYSIPYTGSSALLRAQPARHPVGAFLASIAVRPVGHGRYPVPSAPGTFYDGFVDITFTGRHLHADRVGVELDRIRLSVERTLSFSSAAVARWRRELSATLDESARERRRYLAELLATAQSLEETSSSEYARDADPAPRATPSFSD